MPLSKKPVLMGLPKILAISFWVVSPMWMAETCPAGKVWPVDTQPEKAGHTAKMAVRSDVRIGRVQIAE